MFWKKNVRLRAATTGLVTSVCPLLLYERQPRAKQQPDKMVDQLGGTKLKKEKEPVSGTRDVYRRVCPSFSP